MYRYLFPARTIDDTKQLSCVLAKGLSPGMLLALSGDLATGKTTLTRFLCKELGIQDWFGSPSFTIINEYHGKFPLYHLDFYRISSQEELYYLELERYLYADGITVVEWPEIIAELLDPERTIFVSITLESDSKVRRFLIDSPLPLPLKEVNLDDKQFTGVEKR